MTERTCFKVCEKHDIYRLKRSSYVIRLTAKPRWPNLPERPTCIDTKMWDANKYECQCGLRINANYPVQICFRVLWEIKVDHHINCLNVNSPSEQICTKQAVERLITVWSIMNKYSSDKKIFVYQSLAHSIRTSTKCSTGKEWTIN